MKNNLKSKKRLLLGLAVCVLFISSSVFVTVAERTDEDPFTICVLPDTQMYSQNYPSIFTCMTEWIADNVEQEKIEYVLHVGDIVNENTVYQWENAKASMSVLDGVVSYAIVPGNHDYIGDIGDRDTSMFNAYFPVSDYENWPTFGGIYESDKLDNSYHLFSAGGIDWLVVALEFWPRWEVKNWASQIVRAHPDRITIYLTHYYLDPNGQHSDCGESIWNQVVKNYRNSFMVLCGHAQSTRSISYSNYGNAVHEILTNFQLWDYGGSGYMLLLEFDPEQSIVLAKTYSPWLDNYLHGEPYEFEIEFDKSDYVINNLPGLMNKKPNLIDDSP